MESYKVDSKIFIPLSFRQLQIKKIILVIMLIYTVCVFIELLLRGFDPRIMGSLLIFVFAVNLFFFFMKEGYQPTKLYMGIGKTELCMKYVDVRHDFYKSDMVVTMPIASISNLEYSDKLNALRIEGSSKRVFRGQELENMSEWVIYLDLTNKYQIINSIEEVTGRETKYMDR